ncbi:MAG: 50S ribosomal protein L3 N(5)-glutamine methyltransferase [Cellvibrionaceae bacterium]
MMTKSVSSFSIADCISQGEHLFTEAQLFFGHGTDNAGDEAFWLVFHTLGLPWDSPSSVLEQSVSQSDYQSIQSLFERRVKERIPAAYLTGEAWFAGYAFTVNSDVLVPRSPIAELIYARYEPWLISDTPKILDLCTGSGCIGIASALSLPKAQLTLSDISPEALTVARRNIQRYDLGDRVSAIESDGLVAFDSSNPDHQFDLIVSNPPYVDAVDFATMPEEYHAEPELGLVSGDDGLNFTRQLLANAASFLSVDGVLIVEVGNSDEALQSAFPTAPFLWFEFEQGGHGVFLITRDQLIQHQALFL